MAARFDLGGLDGATAGEITERPILLPAQLAVKDKRFCAHKSVVSVQVLLDALRSF
jgi:hypothetical protein